MQTDTSKSAPQMSTAVAFAQTLVQRQRAQGVGATRAREWLSEKLKVGEGTVRNLVRGRIKRVDETIRERLRALLVRELEAEVMRLQHDLETLRRTGANLGSAEMAEAQAHLDAATAILRGA